jgi:FKBP-type peptidyl-prolyl cis-trans isomerase
VDPIAASYSTGLNFGSQLGSAGLAGTLSVDELVRGIKDGLAGKRPGDEDKARMLQMMREGRGAVAARNRAAASQFLAENGKIAGVVTTASGLQYTEVRPGDPKAAAPGPLDRVTVHYRGRLLDGTEFDSSERHAQAATFSLNGGVIKGWREALLMMKPGAQWRLFVPPELGYDANPPPGIPPGSVLVFDLELVRIEPAPVMGPQPPKSQTGANPAKPKP